jgi:MFS family permease
MTWGATLIASQAQEWHISLYRAATSLNYGILLQGIGGVLAVPLMDAYGRLPLWIWPQVLTLCMVVGCVFAPSFNAFTALRALQGLFGTMPQIIGLPIIHDMYEPAEWAGMINIWGTTFLVGPFLGPALAGYIQSGTGRWRDAFRVLAGLYGASTALVVMFGWETYRGTPRAKAFFGIGNTGLFKAETVLVSSRRAVMLAVKPTLLLLGAATLIFFMWPIGITTTISTILFAPPYLFDEIGNASMRFAGVIGALLGFVVGYAFNEWCTKRQARRLHGVWVPTVSLILGLLTYGLTYHFHKSWVGLAVGWVLINIGLVASMVYVVPPVCSSLTEAGRLQHMLWKGTPSNRQVSRQYSMRGGLGEGLRCLISSLVGSQGTRRRRCLVRRRASWRRAVCCSYCLLFCGGTNAIGRCRK